MKKYVFTLILCLFMSNMMRAQQNKISLKIVETSDVHGIFFPTNFTTGKNIFGSMARVSNYVKKQRQQYGDRLILLENGDILQGQPTNYYYNFIDTTNCNIAAEVVNYMKYDAQVPGNHDIETGHKCYDKWMKDLKCPILGANIMDYNTDECYVKPYIILEREGAKIAILGMLSPAIPNWLDRELWQGLYFENMLLSTKYWVEEIKTNEKPDLIVGLFHSGLEGGIMTPEYNENAVKEIAEQVEGIDIILYGHDHSPYSGTIRRNDGSICIIANPANNARRIAEVDVTLTFDDGKLRSKSMNGRLVSMDTESIDQEYMGYFCKHIEKIKDFTSQTIGTFDKPLYTRDGFFGPSAFNDLIHNLQLDITKADISINAPLHYDAFIKQGVVTMADMFNLCKYENKLYVVKMKGEEIRKHLEMSYALWTNIMFSAEDHIMLLADTHYDAERMGFKNPYFYFDTAAGIDYEVDVTKPEGEKIKILKMSNGEPFSKDKWYKVVMNSYRANGGGELITRGAGISKDSIESRILYRTDLDQRYYLIEEIKKRGHIDPKANNNWRFVPREWTEKAIERDKTIMFHLTK